MKETSMAVPMKSKGPLAEPLYLVRSDEHYMHRNADRDGPAPKELPLLTLDPMEAARLRRARAIGFALVLRGAGFEADLIRILPVPVTRGN